MCSGGKGLRRRSLAGDIRDVVFLPSLEEPIDSSIESIDVDPALWKWMSGLLMLILHCEESRSTLGYSAPSPSFRCPVSCLLSLPGRGLSGHRPGGCWVAVLVEGLAGWLSIGVLGRWCVCSYLWGFFPESAACWRQSPCSAFDLCPVRTRTTLPTLWYCIHVTDWETDMGFTE